MIPFGRLSQLPKELHQMILKFTEDWKTCLNIEAFTAGLPHRFKDVATAMDEVDLVATFPITTLLLKSQRSSDILKLNLSQFILLVRCEEYPLLRNWVDLSANVLVRCDWQWRLGNMASFALQLAYLNPNINIIRHLHSKDLLSFKPKDLVFAAAYDGNIDSLQYLDQLGFQGFTVAATEIAALGGHLDAVKWILETKSIVCNKVVMDNAASNGHLEVVKWLQESRTEGCTVTAMDRAAANGHLEVVKWLHYNRSEGNAKYGAAANGHIEVVKWLHENRTERCHLRTLVDAAYNGHILVVEWLLKNGQGGDNYSLTDAIRVAREYGHEDIVKLLEEEFGRRQGTPNLSPASNE
ncbi:hypothetical protein HDU97_007177 [Phlyctochytrium planicorne]|nr:hypothetical protein HDU97_007177 [Phlyctochytrium planicorne]